MTYDEMLEALPVGEVSIIFAIEDGSYGTYLYKLAASPLPNIAIVGKEFDFDSDDFDDIKEIFQYARILVRDNYHSFYLTKEEAEPFRRNLAIKNHKEQKRLRVEILTRNLEEATGEYIKMLEEENKEYIKMLEEENE